MSPNSNDQFLSLFFVPIFMSITISLKNKKKSIVPRGDIWIKMIS